MSNTIQIKRGSSVPTTSQLAEYELGFNTANNTLYINNGTNVIIPFANVSTSYIKSKSNGNTQELYRPIQLNGLNDNTLDQKINTLRANRLAFLPADQIIIEKTTDGGITWVDAGFNDIKKIALFSETRPSGISLPLLNGVKNINCGLRITITAMKYNVPSGTTETQKYNYWNSSYLQSAERYCKLKELYFWVSTNSDGISVKVERATGANSTSWTSIYDSGSTWAATGWSGCDYIRFTPGTFGGYINQPNNFWNYRFTFFTRNNTGGTTLSTNNTGTAQSIMEIRGYGDTVWTAANSYMSSDHIYTWDYNQNIIFPAQVTASSFNGSISASNISGTLAVAQGGTGTTNVAKNIVFAGPSTGSDNAPSFRALVAADIPNLNASKINDGTFDVARIPNLAASKITSGTLAVAQGGTGLTSLDTFVRTTGTQTVSGTKTFTSYPRIRNTVAATTGAQFPAIFFQGALSTDDLARIGVVTDTNDAPVYIGFRIMSYNSSTYLPLEKYENYYLPQVTADLEDSVSYQVHTTKTLKIQHGFATISTTAPSSNNITYSGFTTIPKVFATYNINATSISGDNTGDKGAIKIYNISTSGCKVVIGGSASGTMRIAWLAIGT